VFIAQSRRPREFRKLKETVTTGVGGWRCSVRTGKNELFVLLKEMLSYDLDLSYHTTSL